jgi:hypothetical protein
VKHTHNAHDTDMSTHDTGGNVDFAFPHAEWFVESLPFTPTAINDARLIVGAQGNQAVQYHNGTVQVLPLGDIDDGGSAVAVDVSSLGAIVGQTENVAARTVVWFPLPLVLPPAPIGVLEPTAINKNIVVVGTVGDAQAAVKWTQAHDYEQLIASERLRHLPTFATDVNDQGFVAGIVADRSEGLPIVWRPDNTPLMLWPQASSFGPHAFINNHGDVAILDRDASRQVTVLHLNGTFESFPAVGDATSIRGISDEGRLIGTSRVNGEERGWTLHNGRLTWLNPPGGASGSVIPIGVNTCGDIVGLTDTGGVAFMKPLPIRCDGARIVLGR